MTTQVKDLPENQSDTVATRLRAAREAVDKSRAVLSKETGIPMKSIEKFEYGSMEPSLTRLQTLCDALDVSVQSIMGNEDADDEQGEQKKATGDNTKKEKEIAEESSPVIDVLNQLDQLDDLRANDFEGGRRRAMVLVDDLIQKLRYLEPEELIKVAMERGLYEGECPTSESILDLFSNDPEKAQQYCGIVEERIADTAVFGQDLYAIEKDAIHNLSKKFHEARDIRHDIEMAGGPVHERLVPVLRPSLRSLAFSGRGEDFGDQDTYPRRS